jgi:hypothetical protein
MMLLLKIDKISFEQLYSIVFTYNCSWIWVLLAVTRPNLSNPAIEIRFHLPVPVLTEELAVATGYRIVKIYHHVFCGILY